jgi:hypothetical protein
MVMPEEPLQRRQADPLLHRGSWTYQAKNSSRPRLYTRRVIGEETLPARVASADAILRRDLLTAVCSFSSPLNGPYR